MNLDQLGRQAGAEIRRVSPGRAADTAGLDELLSRDTRRRRSTVVMAVAVAVLVVALGWRAVAGLGPSGITPLGPTPTPTPTTSSAPGSRVMTPNPVACDLVLRCTGPDAYQLRLKVPVSYTLPPPAWALGTYTATTADFEPNEYGYGVSVMENAKPALSSSRPQVDPSGGTTAQTMARWLAARPFLLSSPVTQTTLSGLPAWQVDVRLKPGQRTIAHCGYYAQDACLPLMLMDISGSHTVGIWGDGRIRWTFVDLPTGGTTAVWTWNFDNNPHGFAPGQPLIDSIRFSGT
jgi:hypothetical protein